MEVVVRLREIELKAILHGGYCQIVGNVEMCGIASIQ